jgi:hypothetical protein
MTALPVSRGPAAAAASVSVAAWLAPVVLGPRRCGRASRGLAVWGGARPRGSRLRHRRGCRPGRRHPRASSSTHGPSRHRRHRRRLDRERPISDRHSSRRCPQRVGSHPCGTRDTTPTAADAAGRRVPPVKRAATYVLARHLGSGGANETDGQPGALTRPCAPPWRVTPELRQVRSTSWARIGTRTKRYGPPALDQLTERRWAARQRRRMRRRSRRCIPATETGDSGRPSGSMNAQGPVAVGRRPSRTSTL